MLKIKKIVFFNDENFDLIILLLNMLEILDLSYT